MITTRPGVSGARGIGRLTAPIRRLTLVLLLLVLADGLRPLSSRHVSPRSHRFADAASATDEASTGSDPRRHSVHHTGLYDDDFFDSLTQLNAPLLQGTDPVSRLQKALFETPEARRARETSAQKAEYIYSGRNNTHSTITTLSMSSVSTMDGTSSCSATLGCPRSSVAWASGTFTFTELLTPASLSTEANLSLKISLCCDYKFHGALLRDTARYSQFLSFLLQASPFQSLSAEAKAQLFPQRKAFIVNSKTGQAYNHTYTLTESDQQSGNDGDGDVIVLFTGRVDAHELAKVTFTSLRSPTAHHGDDAASAGGTATAAFEDSSADMQLKVVNTVLKCKCPHTLLVMPLLHMQRDVLPPVEILGLGPHCGTTPTQSRVKPHRFLTRVLRDGVTREMVEEARQAARDDGHASLRAVDHLVGYATSFLLSPPVLPASEVRWVVREEGPKGRVVLDHTRVLVAEVDSTGALLLDHAPSPYWMVEPDVRYHVEVTVTRQGVRQSAQGPFVMRLPFHRPWALPPVRPAPHFGFDRTLRLSAQETLAHEQVPLALDARTTSGTRRPLFYYGYWENTPLQDQPLPQKPVQVRQNPFDTPEVRFPLFIGKNILAYFVRDVDDVCDPVPLEGRELWAVQSIITTPTPLTACAEEQDIAALILRQLLWRMRQEKHFLVNVPDTAWTSPQAEEGKEGDFVCGLWQHPNGTSQPQTRGMCQATPTMDGGVSGTTARLRLPRRNVYQVVWAASLVVNNRSSAAAMLVDENIDHAYVTVHTEAPNPVDGTESSRTPRDGSHIRVEVRSRPHLVVRRTATYPSAITVELPMHERRWRVSPPRPLQSAALDAAVDEADTSSHGVRRQPYAPRATHGAEDDAPNGYWLAHNPLAIRSVNERLEAWLDTSSVPNVQRVLPNKTLVFVAQDSGEDLRYGYGVSYLARCPDVPVEVLISVVAIKAPPIVPAYVPVYTEDSCVEVRPPRALRKDEVLQWRVPACPQASHPPFLVQREVNYDDAALEAAAARVRARRGTTKRHRQVDRDDDESDDDDVDRGALAHALDEELPGVPIPGTGGRRRAVMLACGVEVYTHCDVTWTATNLVGMVTKTYSLRRCQRPPDVVFHVDGLQQDRGLPARYFSLPSLLERVSTEVDIGVNTTAPGERVATLPVYTYSAYNSAEDAWYVHRRIIGEHEYVPYVVPEVDGDDLQEMLHATTLYRQRTVIPIAGYDGDVGYSFNFSGPQAYFEAEMTPLIGLATNQLMHTRAHFTYPDGTRHGDDRLSEVERRRVAVAAGDFPWLIWRRLGRLDVALTREEMPYPGTAGDDNVDGSDWQWQRQPVYGDEDLEDADAEAAPYVRRDAAGTDDDDLFWADLYSRRQGRHGDDGSDHLARTAPNPVEVYFQRLEREAQRRTRAEDHRLNRVFLLRHHVDRRRLELHRLHNASLYPVDYVVRASRIAPNAAVEADRPEFARRGMCLEHPGHTSLLVVNPRGAVREDERYGTVLPPPPPPAVAVLPFCQPQYVFSRHPHLSVLYHFDFTWECEDTAVMETAKRDPVYSTITHVEAPAANGSRATHHNATNCRLVVQNHLTETIRADWFLLQRVFPTVLTRAHFVVLGDGSPHTVRVRAPSAGAGGALPHRGTSRARDGKDPELYELRSNGHDGRAWRVVGPSAVVHVDAPSNPHTARWSLRSFIPQLSDPSGTEAVMAQVHFTHLFQHPAAVARDRGGSTALIKGLTEPGLYTIDHYLPDPAYPNVCPNVSLVETLDVFRAQVLERELFICGGTATLRAVPIPHDLSHAFVAQWEVVALQTAPDEVWTRGVNFTGIRFDHGSRETTLVHGLPFGILTIRWAIYRVYTEAVGDDPDDYDKDVYGEEKLFSRGTHTTSDTPRRRTRERRVLVDYDSVRVVVLTENLFSHRLVTLSSAADVVTTSSTVDWFVRESPDEPTPSGKKNTKATRKGLWGQAGTPWQDSLDPRLGWQPLLNFTGYYPLNDPVLFPYVGAHPPRPGAGLLTMEQVPVGSTELMYTLRPSENVFGPMVGQTCELRGSFLIERVSAYFTVNTTLDHECDGYTGTAKVSMCLHAEVPPAVADAQLRRRKASPTWRSTRQAGQSAGSSSRQDAWAANVQLVPLDALEQVMKDGAKQAEEAGCAVPWWVWADTRWTDLTPIRREGLPRGRCVRFTVQAGRHLSPREVTLPLFLASPGGDRTRSSSSSSTLGNREAYGRSVALVDGNGAVVADGGDGASGGSTSRGHRVCAATPDFITSRVIDGAGHISLEDTSTGKHADRGLAGSFIFSHQQKHHRGMLAYLPILDPHTLYRRDVAMRPLVGLQGLPDDVTTEVNVTRGNESIVTLRLDMSEPRLLGGYVVFHDPTAAPVLQHDENDEAEMNDGTPLPGEPVMHNGTEDASSALPHRTRHRSLLLQCVHGHVRAADVLQFWVETNRPDGVVGRTADEWLEYVHAVQDQPVPCEVLFPSLEHVLSTTEVIGRTGKTRVVASSTTSDTMAPPPSGAGLAIGSAAAAAQASSRTAASASPFHSPHGAELVPLEVIELQLERIQRAFRITQDGIDVTGLRPELQLALARRRLTPQQLRELEQARQTILNDEKSRNAKQRLELMNAPSLMSRAERVRKVMETYRGVTGLEPSAVRLRLPRYEAFSTPYDLLLRTALHKDVVCGTHIAYPPRVPTRVPTPVPNRHSLVTMGRVEILDVAPMLTPPGPVKQCEVEGDVPVLLVNISGAVFSAPFFTADQVELRELPNPNLPPNASPYVGLTPCLDTLRSGMHAVVGHTSRKTLYLQLSACPSFQMLSLEEYNEYQDSDELLRRLQHPRYLQVRIREALRADSFTARGQNARDVTFVVEVRPTLARLHLHAAELAATHPHTRHEPVQPLRGAAAAIRSVLPLGGGAARDKAYEQRHSGPTFQSTAQRPLLMCESDLRHNGFELGIELIGDSWTSPVGMDGEEAIQHDAAAAEEAARRAGAAGHSWRPTISARGALNEPTRRRAPQNTALINSFSIVEHYSLDSTHHLYLKGGGVYRSHFVNYLFSTILADRDILLYHEFVRRYNDTFVSVEVPPQPESAVLGLGRLEVWGDAEGLFEGDVITDDPSYHAGGTGSGGAAYGRGRGRYDGTRDDLRAQRAWRELPAVRRFSKVEEILFAVPGIATNCHGCLLADTTFFVAGDLTGIWAFLEPRRATGATSTGTATPLSPHHLTARQLPSFGTPSLESAYLSRPLIIPWDAVERIPTQWHLMWLCPASAYRALAQFQQYWRAPVVPSAGEGGAYVEASVVVYALRDATGAELTPSQRPTTLLTSEPVSLAQLVAQSQQQPPSTPTNNLGGASSSPAVLASNVRFHMNSSSISAAYTAVAADLLRYRRPQVIASHAFAFHRDGLYTDGLLSVNASVFVKLCVPLPPSSYRDGVREEATVVDGTGEVRARSATREDEDVAAAAAHKSAPHRQCMIVSITDTLLTVEAPAGPRRRTHSWVQRVFGRGGDGARRARTSTVYAPRYASPLTNGTAAGDVAGQRAWTWAVWLHNVLLSLLIYVLVPNLGLIDDRAERDDRAYRGSRADTESRTSSGSGGGSVATPARVGLSLMTFVLLMFASVQSPTTLWVLCWLAIWSAALYIYKSPEAVVCFVVSAVYWRLTLDLP